MMTPTFLAGFCTVLASILAYGTTQTHLLYSNGLPACAEASCSTAPHPENGGGLGESASPGIGGSQHGTRSSQPAQAAQPPPVTGGGGGGGAQPSRSPGTHSRHQAAPRRHVGHPAGGAPQAEVSVVYQTRKRWSGRFLGLVTITNTGKTVLPGWQLQMKYRQVKISSMWGARWLPAHPRSGTGVVAALAAQRPLQPGMSAEFTFLARGAPGLPGGCAFNGYRCTFRHHRPHKPHKPGSHRKHAGSPGTPHGGNPGTSHASSPGKSQAHSPGTDSVRVTALILPGASRPGHAHAKGHAHAYVKGHAHAKGHIHAYAVGHPHATSRPHSKGHPQGKSHPHGQGRHHHGHTGRGRHDGTRLRYRLI